MRVGGQNVYYINLRVSDGKGSTDEIKTRDAVLNLNRLLYAVGKECD